MIHKKKYEAVIFDMDGVIVDNQQYHHDSWMQFFQKYGLEVGGNVSQYFGRTNTDILSNVFPDQLSSQQLYNYAGEKEKLYRELYEGNVEAADGLEDLLKKLQEGGYKLGVATSAPSANVDFVLGNTNLHVYFDAVVDSSMVKQGKPDPEIYLKTARELGTKPEYCVVIEDSVAGVKAAKGAGMMVIAITSTNSKENLNEADKIIDHFNEFEI
jgi:beta-phosphoglucomutase family hydrolase